MAGVAAIVIFLPWYSFELLSAVSASVRRLFFLFWLFAFYAGRALPPFVAPPVSVVLTRFFGHLPALALAMFARDASRFFSDFDDPPLLLNCL